MAKSRQMSKSKATMRATSTLPLILCLCSSGGSSAFVPGSVDVPRLSSRVGRDASHESCGGSSAFVPGSADVPRLSSRVGRDASPESSQSALSLSATSSRSRRSFLVATSASLLISSTSTIQPAGATLMDATQDEAKTFSPGTKLSVEENKQRFRAARQDVQYLLDHYEKISEGGGDAVRRYLGTVGVSSNMYGITKVVKDLRDEAEDLVEYTETANEFEAYLYQAEGAAYQSLFVEHSSAKGTPASFLATAKKDVVSMQRYMDDLAKQLDL